MHPFLTIKNSSWLHPGRVAKPLVSPLTAWYPTSGAREAKECSQACCQNLYQAQQNQHAVEMEQNPSAFQSKRHHSCRSMQWRRQDFSLGRIEAPRGRGAEGSGVRGGVSPSSPGEESGEGAVPPPHKIFDYLILKWRILIHISSILTYLF